MDHLKHSSPQGGATHKHTHTHTAVIHLKSWTPFRWKWDTPLGTIINTKNIGAKNTHTHTKCVQEKPRHVVQTPHAHKQHTHTHNWRNTKQSYHGPNTKVLSQTQTGDGVVHGQCLNLSFRSVDACTCSSHWMQYNDRRRSQGTVAGT